MKNQSDKLSKSSDVIKKSNSNICLTRSLDSIDKNNTETMIRAHSFFCDKQEKISKFCINQLTINTLLELFFSEDKNEINLLIEDLKRKSLLPCNALLILSGALVNWVTKIDSNKIIELQYEVSPLIAYVVNQFNNSKIVMNAMNIATHAQITNNLSVLGRLNKHFEGPLVSSKKLSQIGRILSINKQNSKTIANYISGIGLLIHYKQLDYDQISGKSLNALISMQINLPVEQLEYKDLTKSFYGFVWQVKSCSLMNFSVSVDAIIKLITMIIELVPNDTIEQVKTYISSALIDLKDNQYLNNIDVDQIIKKSFVYSELSENIALNTLNQNEESIRLKP